MDELAPAVIQHSQAVVQPNPPQTMDTIMNVPILKTLQCFADWARTIGCLELLFSHDASILWTIQSPAIPSLPSNMQPTVVQLNIPHHPILDILPWPSVRTKLIYAFSLPMEQRPGVARTEMALIQLAYDIEDEKDGFIVHGDGRKTEDWEVGSLFLKNWWWALDGGVVETSNSWRAARGQRQLRMNSA